ncbi:palmdelphin [Thomomys bottae]
MEEAELVKERLQAITDKRKIQEEISQKRLKIEEEKLKHQHLKKKALREKWLLDGISSGREQDEMRRQNQQDQHQIQVLEQSILRLEREIEDLEKAELQISTNEEAILKKLKSVERTTEDIIRSVKVEKEEMPGESIEDIYANIPDLPNSYVPTRLRKERTEGIDDDEQNRKALYAMEIRVEKDLKTGESTVLSSIPLPSDDLGGAGVKVYDDGRTSVHALGTRAGGGAPGGGGAGLGPGEVQELLRQAAERSARSPTELHPPVYANPFRRPATPRAAARRPCVENGLCGRPGPHEPSPGPAPTGQPRAHSSPDTCQGEEKEEEEGREDWEEKEEEQDVRYNVVHALPSDVADAEPVTMIFMGYQQAEDDAEERKLLSGYDGVIHAELVVIDDEEEEEEEDGEARQPRRHLPGGPPSDRPTPLPRKRPEGRPQESAHHGSPHTNSISLEEQEERLGRPASHSPPRVPGLGDGTEDPSLTALRMRMAKLGKKVI